MLGRGEHTSGQVVRPAKTLPLGLLIAVEGQQAHTSQLLPMFEDDRPIGLRAKIAIPFGGHLDRLQLADNPPIMVADDAGLRVVEHQPAPG